MRTGFWCSAISERSSNYREFRNLLETIKDAAREGQLTGAEVWMFTDNQVAERCFYRGSAKDAMLFAMVLDLRTLTIEEGFILHVVHVAGTRLIGQGADALSRGERQLRGLIDPEQNVVPLHLDPIQRSPVLKHWLGDWLGTSQEELRYCAPFDWPCNGHMPGLKIWSLPPAAALYALEELATARLKRMEQVSAVVLVPMLMAPDWLRRFIRVVDLYFVVPAGAPFWPADMHESLMIGLSLPLLRCDPWEWRDVSFMVALGRALSGMHKADDAVGLDLLRKFWAAYCRAIVMPPDVVRPMLQDPSYHRFLSLSGKRRGRKGVDGGG